MDEELVSIVLVNYYGNEDTVECINSINRMLTYSNYEIIVVDNSTDEAMCQMLMKERLAHTEIIRSKTNDGFAAACNIGILRAQEHNASYVLLLNNDTLIKSNDLIEQLLKGFEVPEVGMTGGKIYYYSSPSEIWYAAGYTSKIRLRAKNREKIAGITETPFITGCMQLISINAIKKIGLLCEDYFLTYEDNDYCERLHESGLKTVYNSDAQIYHKVSKSNVPSSASSIYYSNRARYIFMKRFCKMNILARIDYWIELIVKLIFYKNANKDAILKVLKDISKSDIL